MIGPALPLAVLLAAAPAAPPSFTLPSGLRVQVAPDHDRPYLELELEVTWPAGEETAGREGAATLLGRVLQVAGAGPHDPAAFQRTLEERGFEARFQHGPGRYLWTLRCPSARQEEAFALLAHRVLRPALGGTELEGQRARMAQERQALGLAEWTARRFRWELVEGRPEGLATERSLSELGLDHLIALHRRLVRPERARLRLKGDLSPAQARQLAILHFGVWGPGAEPALAPAPKAQPRPPATAGCLATTTGQPAALLALLPPPGAPPEALERLARLLPRWLLAGPPEGVRGEGRVARLEDGRPGVVLRAPGPGDPAALLLGLRQWAAQLWARSLPEADLKVAAKLRAGELAGDPWAGPPPDVSAADLAATLRAWFAPERQRALLTGALEVPPGHPALEGLGPLVWVRAKD